MCLVYFFLGNSRAVKTDKSVASLMKKMPKRQNLAGIQQSAVVPCPGYQVMPVRTGYESIIGERLGDLYVKKAKMDGTVLEVNDDYIKVQYSDGTTEGFEVGVYHGKAEGKVIPHHFSTDVEKGQKFDAGFFLAWNDGFFDRDFFHPGNVVMKIGCLARTVLLENNDTLEDGSRHSQAIVQKLKTRVSKEVGILVNQDQLILDLVKKGDKVSKDDPLCTIMEASTAAIEQTDESLAALARLSGSSKSAPKSGTIGKVEIFYNAELDSMSDNLKKLVEADNRRRAKIAKETGKRMAKNGRITRASFVAGEKVLPGKVCIVVTIDGVSPFNPGDKGSVGNQLKTISGGTLEGSNFTEDGKPIDLIFGYQSVNARIVGSPNKQGSLNTTMIGVTDIFFKILTTGKTE